MTPAGETVRYVLVTTAIHHRGLEIFNTMSPKFDLLENSGLRNPEALRGR